MEENLSGLELQVDQSASKNLLEAARWAKFLSVAGFICMALLIICFVAAQGLISNALSQLVPAITAEEGYGIILVIILVAAIIVCLLMYFLFRGSVLIKRGIETKSQETFNNGLASLKAYFIMYGFFAILGVVVNLVSLL